MSRPATLLRALVAVHLLWTFLLTPVALEPRPFSAITAIGYLSLVLIFTVVALDIAAFIFVGRNPRRASSLAAAGPFLFVGPFIGDQLGLFATTRPPTQITVLEIAAFATQLALLYTAVRLRLASEQHAT
jgi:hypothetical protein